MMATTAASYHMLLKEQSNLPPCRDILAAVFSVYFVGFLFLGRLRLMIEYRNKQITTMLLCYHIAESCTLCFNEQTDEAEGTFWLEGEVNTYFLC